MPSIPRYGQSRVAPGPLPSPQVALAIPKGAYGQDAAGAWAQALKNEQLRAEQADVNRGIAEYNGWALNYSQGEDGIFGKKLDDFMAASSETESLSLDARNRIAGGITSPRAREQFVQQSLQGHQRLMGAVLRQATTERGAISERNYKQAWATNLDVSIRATTLGLAVDDDGDLDTSDFDVEMGRAEAWLRGHAAANAGHLGTLTPGDFVSQQKDAYAKALAAGVMAAALLPDENGIVDDQVARATLEAMEPLIPGGKLPALRVRVDEATQAAVVRETSVDILSEVADPDLSQSIEQERTAANVMIDEIENEAVRRDVRASVKTEMTAQIARRDADNEALRGSLEQQILDGVPLETIRSHATWNDPNGLSLDKDFKSLKKFAEDRSRSFHRPFSESKVGELRLLVATDPKNKALSDAALRQDFLNGDITEAHYNDIKRWRIDPEKASATVPGLRESLYVITEAADLLADDEQGDFKYYMTEQARVRYEASPGKPLTPTDLKAILSDYDARIFTNEPGDKSFLNRLFGNRSSTRLGKVIPLEQRAALERQFISAFGARAYDDSGLDEQGLFEFSQLSPDDRADLARGGGQ